MDAPLSAHADTRTPAARKHTRRLTFLPAAMPAAYATASPGYWLTPIHPAFFYQFAEMRSSGIETVLAPAFVLIWNVP